MERNLGRQNSTDAGGRPANPKTARKRLWKAWDEAERWLSEQERPWSADAARDNARALADSLATFALEDNDLTASERALLTYVAAVAAKRGSDLLTIPRAALIEGSGLGLTALRTALAGLDHRRVLTLATAGTKRAKGKPGRASVYRLGASLNQSAYAVSGAPPDLAVPPLRCPPELAVPPPFQLQPRSRTKWTASP